MSEKTSHESKPAPKKRSEREMNEKDLDQVAGGFNPQPDPPKTPE